MVIFFLLVISVLFITIPIIISKLEVSDLEEYKNYLNGLGFKEVIFDKKIQIYFNEKTEKWKYNFVEDTFKFNDILSCEILENGSTTMKTKTKNKVSLSNAVIGGALFGTVGAIIGGTAGKSISDSVQTDYCVSLKVKVTLKDLNNPCVFINIINKNISKNSSEYKQSYELAQKVISIFQIIIDSRKQ